MGRRKTTDLYSNGSKRTRVTISIPEGVRAVIPNDANFSGIVSQLLEENLERIANVPVEEIQRKRSQKLVEIILTKINEMGKDIAKQVVAEDARAFDIPLTEIDKRIDELKRTAIQLSELKDSLVDTRRIRSGVIHGIVKEEIKNTVFRMVGEKNLMLLDDDEDGRRDNSHKKNVLHGGREIWMERTTPRSRDSIETPSGNGKTKDSGGNKKTSTPDGQDEGNPPDKETQLDTQSVERTETGSDSTS